jgi:hypothetical protein
VGGGTVRETGKFFVSTRGWFVEGVRNESREEFENSFVSTQGWFMEGVGNGSMGELGKVP